MELQSTPVESKIESFTDTGSCTSEISSDNKIDLQLDITTRQSLFNQRFVASFLARKRKYIQTLEEYGGLNRVTGIESGDSLDGDLETSFNEEIEIIISENKNRLSVTCGKRGHYSISGLFRHIYHVLRRTKASRITSKLQYIREHDLIETLRHVASQISSAYQYQILLMANEIEVCKMADHAVSCIISYLKLRHSEFHPSSLLQAVVENSPKMYFSEEQFLKTRIISPHSANKTLFDRWKVQDVFKQPGLRVYQPHTGDYKFYGCFTPFGYKCKPHKYGFRGPLYVWDEENSNYSMLLIDQVSSHSNHNREIPFIPNNYHYIYKPLRQTSVTDAQTNNENNSERHQS